MTRQEHVADLDAQLGRVIEASGIDSHAAGAAFLQVYRAVRAFGLCGVAIRAACPNYDRFIVHTRCRGEA